MMLFNTALFVAVGSIVAAPQYYYSNYNQVLSSRLGRSTYKKCPSGFIANAVNDCVKPEIERFYFLFESPKSSVGQPPSSNHLAGNVYNGNTPAAISPFFFVVQPEKQQRPISGVKPFANYQTIKNQQPNSLFLHEVGHKFLPLSQQQDDSISDTSYENELSYDYSRQFQPSSGYQSLNQNLLQERIPEIDSTATRITSFHPPSAAGHPPSATEHQTDQTKTKLSNLLSDEIYSTGETYKVSQSDTFDERPSETLAHIDDGVSSFPVEEDPSSSTVNNVAPSILTFPGSDLNSNSVSNASPSIDKVNTIHSSVDTFQSAGNGAAVGPFAEITTVDNYTNGGLGSVAPGGKESAVDLIDLRTFNDESGSITIDQQPSSALTLIDGGVSSSPVEEEPPISTTFNGATSFFTVPGTTQKASSISKATLKKGTLKNIQSTADTSQSSNDDISFKPAEKLIASKEGTAQVIAVDKESTNGLVELNTFNDETSIITAGQQPFTAMANDNRGVKSSLVEEDLIISNVNKNSAANFFTVPGTKKQSNSASRTAHNKDAAKSNQRPRSTDHSSRADSATEPLVEFITVARHPKEDDVPVPVDDTESAEASLFIRMEDEDSSNEKGEDVATRITVPVARINSEYDEDQIAQDSVANKNTASVYFVQSKLAGENTEFKTPALESQSNFNNKNTVLLDKATSEINNNFKLENFKIKGKGLELNEMFEHIKSNITSRIADSNSYKGFVYIVADEGKEIVYEF